MKRLVKYKYGFTLIELLVVIAVIGIILGLSLIGLTGTKEASRNARRKTDLESMRASLELYKADKGVYPQKNNCVSSIGNCGSCPCSGSSWSTSSYLYTGLVDESYMTGLPKDPLNTTNYYYDYVSVCNGETSTVCGVSRSCPTGAANCCAYSLKGRLENGSTYEVCSP